MSPHDRIVTARKTWQFAFFVAGSVNGGRITPKTFVNPLRFLTSAEGEPDRGLEFWHRFTPGDLETLAFNNAVGATTHVAITVDEALDEAFGLPSPRARKTHPDPAIAGLRCVTYLIRCAFAHGPLEPQWQIAPRYRDDLYAVEPAGVKLDTTGLHGSQVSANQFGGWEGFHRLLGYAETIIDGR